MEYSKKGKSVAAFLYTGICLFYILSSKFINTSTHQGVVNLYTPTTPSRLRTHAHTRTHPHKHALKYPPQDTPPNLMNPCRYYLLIWRVKNYLEWGDLRHFNTLNIFYFTKTVGGRALANRVSWNLPSKLTMVDVLCMQYN